MTPEVDKLLVRKIAAKHEIHERTLMKALGGETSRVASVAARAKKAVEEYKAETEKTGPTPEKDHAG